MRHPAVVAASCLKTNSSFASSVPCHCVVPEAPAQADNGRQTHPVHYLFDSLRGPSQHDRPASRSSPAPVLSRDGSQSCSKGVSGEQRWLRRPSLTRGARPLLLRSRLLAFLCCVSPLSLLSNAFVLKGGGISGMRDALPQRMAICASVAPCITTINKRRVASLCACGEVPAAAAARLRLPCLEAASLWPCCPTFSVSDVPRKALLRASVRVLGAGRVEQRSSCGC